VSSVERRGDGCEHLELLRPVFEVGERVATAPPAARSFTVASNANRVGTAASCGSTTT